MTYPYAALGVLAALALAGCSIDNPLFAVSSGTTDATSGGSDDTGATSVTPTSDPVTSTSGPDTSGSETGVTTSDPQTGGSTTSQTATSVDSETGESTDVGVDTGTSSGGVDLPMCGNGLSEQGEECDDGNQTQTDECTNLCKAAFCGDGLIWAGVEECDLAGENSDNGACTATCSTAVCGDGLLQGGGVEQCDGGAKNGWLPGLCSEDCQATISPDPLLIKVLPNQVPGNFSFENVFGFLGADLQCAKAFGAGYKILASDGVTRIASKTPYTGGTDDWVLQPYRAYKNVSDKLVFVTGAEALLGVRKQAPVALLSPISGGGVPVWTGLKPDWTSAESNCTGWTTKSDLKNGAVGVANAVDSKFIHDGTKLCLNYLSFYCVQQPK